MRKLAGLRVVSAALLTASLLLGITTVAVPPARAVSVSQAYYLFYRRITSINANCRWSGNHYLGYHGIVKLSPYRTYKRVDDGETSVGNFIYDYYWMDGFSTAAKDEYCRHNDYVWEYFGAHKVRRHLTQIWIFSGGSYLPAGNIWTPWKSYGWI